MPACGRPLYGDNGGNCSTSKRMKRTLALAVCVPLLAACATSPLQHKSGAVITACLDELQRRAGKSLAPQVDRAYVYAQDGHYWVHFTRGDLGTFGRRSHDYEVLLDCGAVYAAAPETLFLGEPMEEPWLDMPDRDYFVTPTGSTELKFIRSAEGFEYCCSQQFSRTNLVIHNPAL